YDPRTKLSEQVVAEVRRYFGDRVYDTIIPRTVRLSEAPGFGQPITIYDSRSRGAQSYRALAREVAAKLPDEAPLPVIDDLPSVMVPPPEPTVTRAPRPLVREDEAPEEAPEEAEEGAELAGTPVGADQAQLSPEAEAAELGVAPVDPPRPAAPQGDGDDRPASARVEPVTPAIDEGSRSTGPNGSPEAETVQTPVLAGSESGVEVQQRRGASVGAHQQARPVETESEPEVSTDPESRRTVLVAEDRSGAEGNSDEEPEVDGDESSAGRRRWGLFRRRGDR
ncbi:MAG: hypothetical protein WD834_04565, partial [Actinomycetota bacterium]